MATQYKDRNLRRSIGISVRPGTHRQSGLQAALIKIASIRYQAFRERFGRDPLPDEPLFFDPISDEPTASATAEMHGQLLAAASATNSDALSLSQFFRLPFLNGDG